MPEGKAWQAQRMKGVPATQLFPRERLVDALGELRGFLRSGRESLKERPTRARR